MTEEVWMAVLPAFCLFGQQPTGDSFLAERHPRRNANATIVRPNRERLASGRIRSCGGSL